MRRSGLVRNVTPRTARNDLTDGSCRDAKPRSNIALLFPSFYASQNARHITLGQLGGAVLGAFGARQLVRCFAASGGALLRLSVSDVVLVCPEKQMRRADARRRVAPVTHAHSWRNVAERQDVRHAMSQPRRAPVSHAAVPVLVFGTYPEKTARGGIQSRAGIEGHASFYHAEAA